MQWRTAAYHPLMSPHWLIITAAAAGIALLLLALHLTFIWMERKGWLYYRKPRPASSYSATRGVLSTFQEILQPEIRYVKEDRDQRLSVSRPEDPSTR
jgi:hypothetical protein